MLLRILDRDSTLPVVILPRAGFFLLSPLPEVRLRYIPSEASHGRTIPSTVCFPRVTNKEGDV